MGNCQRLGTYRSFLGFAWNSSNNITCSLQKLHQPWFISNRQHHLFYFEQIRHQFLCHICLVISLFTKKEEWTWLYSKCLMWRINNEIKMRHDVTAWDQKKHKNTFAKRISARLLDLLIIAFLFRSRSKLTNVFSLKFNVLTTLVSGQTSINNLKYKSR